MSPSSSLTFPIPELTKIQGKPSNTSIKLLRKELYTNARAIPSTRGGGNHGHLALVMTDAAYLALTHNAFTLPGHPGPAPVHGDNATGAQIAETIRIYNAELAEIAISSTFRATIKQQIIAAVDDLYLSAISHEEFGFADVTPFQMLEHLQATYGIITRAEVEHNRGSIQSAWNLDDPIEMLWTRLTEIRRISREAQEELSAATIMELTILMFEHTGVFTTACDMWRIKPDGDKTYTNFMAHFTAENKERIRRLTISQAGYQGANAVTPGTLPTVAANAATQAAPAPTNQVIANDGTRMYYCWSHGLGTNPRHTSALCQRKADGHKDDSTVINMQGGNNTIMSGGRRRLPHH
jgi:hypothetical protein